MSSAPRRQGGGPKSVAQAFGRSRPRPVLWRGGGGAPVGAAPARQRGQARPWGQAAAGIAGRPSGRRRAAWTRVRRRPGFSAAPRRLPAPGTKTAYRSLSARRLRNSPSSRWAGNDCGLVFEDDALAAVSKVEARARAASATSASTSGGSAVGPWCPRVISWNASRIRVFLVRELLHHRHGKVEIPLPLLADDGGRVDQGPGQVGAVGGARNLSPALRAAAHRADGLPERRAGPARLPLTAQRARHRRSLAHGFASGQSTWTRRLSASIRNYGDVSWTRDVAILLPQH